MHAWKVGQAIVYPRERRVFVDGAERRLGGRAFDLLQALLQSPDRVVGRDELIDTVWADVAVEPNNVAVQMLALRRLLGPGAVVTVPRRGYRLAATVEPLQAPSPRPALSAGDRPAFESTCRWLADQLAARRWLTLAGGDAVARHALARGICELHRREHRSVTWHLPHANAALPGLELKQRLGRTGALLLVANADGPRRAALAEWLRGPGAPRVLALSADIEGAPVAQHGEALVPLRGSLGANEDATPDPVEAPGLASSKPARSHPLRAASHRDSTRTPDKAK